MNPYEHFSKEVLKQTIDNNPNYPDWVKVELKAIIDAAQTPEEVVIGILAFFDVYRPW